MKKILVLVLCLVFLSVIGAYGAQQYHRPPPPPRPAPPTHHYNPPPQHHNPPAQHHHHGGPGGRGHWSGGSPNVGVWIDEEPVVIGEGTTPPCFVATAVYGSYDAGEVQILREFRDSRLLTNDFGKKIVAFYYENGPTAAKVVNDHSYVKPLLKIGFMPIVGFCYLVN